MDSMKIIVKYEGKKIEETFNKPVDFIYSRQNPEFIQMIEQKCKESGFDKPDKVQVKVTFDI